MWVEKEEEWVERERGGRRIPGGVAFECALFTEEARNELVVDSSSH